MLGTLIAAANLFLLFAVLMVVIYVFAVWLPAHGPWRSPSRTHPADCHGDGRCPPDE
jgi:hypothetical protein